MAVCNRCTDISLDDGALYALSPFRLMVSSECPGCSFFLKLAEQHELDLVDASDREVQVLLRRPDRDENSVIVLFVEIDGTDISTVKDIEIRLCNSASFEGPFCLEYQEEQSKGLGRLVPDNDGDDECLDLAKVWFEHCIQTHGPLCSLEKKVPLPTRLIHIHPDDPEKLTLCITHGMLGQYVTLSYCWGEAVPFKTVSTNLKKLESGFAASELPQTLRDAVRLTYKMGFEWLWIDSLCIIQDDFNDWSCESALMAHVYGEAAFTICADSTDSADDGIFGDRDMLRSHDFGPDLEFCLQTKCTPWGDMSDHQLYDRGWAFQERVLSSRNLHFLFNQLAWECNTTVYMEGTGGRHDKPDDHFAKNLFTKFCHQKRMEAAGNSEKMKLLDTIDRWNLIIQEMAVRDFTFENDRLPAVSGLASAMQTTALGEYFAGVWSSHPFLSMVWFMRWPQSKSENYLSPSWSWVWTKGQIIWQTNTWGVSQPAGSTDMSDWNFWHETYEPQLMDHKMNHKSSDPKGELLEGSYMVISGHCRTVFVLERPDTDFDYNWDDMLEGCEGKSVRQGLRVCMDSRTNNEDSLASFDQNFSDADDEVDTTEVREYLCVQIAREWKEKIWDPKVIALVLERVDGIDIETYRRVGLLMFSDVEEGKWTRKTLKLL